MACPSLSTPFLRVQPVRAPAAHPLPPRREHGCEHTSCNAPNTADRRPLSSSYGGWSMPCGRSPARQARRPAQASFARAGPGGPAQTRRSAPLKGQSPAAGQEACPTTPFTTGKSNQVRHGFFFPFLPAPPGHLLLFHLTFLYV